jgi:hypothetical protein
MVLYPFCPHMVRMGSKLGLRSPRISGKRKILAQMHSEEQKDRPLEEAIDARERRTKIGDGHFICPRKSL